MDDFDFQQDSGDEEILPGFYDTKDREEKERTKRDLKNAGINVSPEKFTDPLALQVFKEKAPSLSFLYEYMDHNDHYQDPATKTFAKWYLKPKHATQARLFVAASIEARKETRENEGGSCSLDKFRSQFNRTMMQLADTIEKNDTIIPAYIYTPRIARIYNIWYSKTYKADGARIFATGRLGSMHKCETCNSVTIDGVHTASLEWQFLRESWKAHNSLTLEEFVRRHLGDA